MRRGIAKTCMCAQRWPLHASAAHSEWQAPQDKTQTAVSAQRRQRGREGRHDSGTSPQLGTTHSQICRQQQQAPPIQRLARAAGAAHHSVEFFELPLQASLREACSSRRAWGPAARDSADAVPKQRMADVAIAT